MSQVSSRSLNDAVSAIDRLTGAINSIAPFFQHLAGTCGDSKNLERSQDVGTEEQKSLKTLYFNEKALKEIKYHFQNVSSLSDKEKIKMMNTFMELYLVASYVSSCKENTKMVVVPALFSTTGKETEFDVHTIMNKIVKERFPSRYGEHHIGTIVTVIVDGFDYYTAKSTRDMFSLWDLTIFHPNNKTPPKSVAILAKECFFQDSKCGVE